MASTRQQRSDIPAIRISNCSSDSERSIVSNKSTTGTNGLLRPPMFKSSSFTTHVIANKNINPVDKMHFFKGLHNIRMKEETEIIKSREDVYKKRRRVGTESQFIPQYKLENTKLPKFMLLHFSRTRIIWDWIILLVVAYIAITIPFNVAFKVENLYLLVLDLCLELLFICDIAFNFRTTHIESKSGKLVTNPRDIAMNYIKGWFTIDCMAAIPFELLYFCDNSLIFAVSIIKSVRMLRLFRVGRRISRYIEYTATLLILMMFSFALLAHWLACIWYIIGYEEIHDGNSNGWLYTLGTQTGKHFFGKNQTCGLSTGEQYIGALYFIFTSLTTVGFGNIAPNTVAEKTFSVIVLLLGAMVQSAIFGNMTAVIQKLYAARARFHAKASQIKQFVRHHQIDGDLRRRIEDWFISYWSISKGVNTDEMLESFPSELQADICSHLYRCFLTLPCFLHASRGCLRSISLKVKKAYYSPGELIIKEKDVINALFFVQRGTIEIVQRDFIVAILGTGDIFGDDISRTKQVRKSNGDVRALMYCDILYLTKENIKEVLLDYPDFCQPFSENIGLTFDLGNNRRRISSNSLTGLNCIEEEVENLSRDSSSPINLSSDESEASTIGRKAKRKLSKERSRNNNNIPLWQQKIRLQERGLNKSPSISLKNRLMKINSDTDDGASQHGIETSFADASDGVLFTAITTERASISSDTSVRDYVDAFDSEIVAINADSISNHNPDENSSDQLNHYSLRYPRLPMNGERSARRTDNNEPTEYFDNVANENQIFTESACNGRKSSANIANTTSCHSLPEFYLSSSGSPVDFQTVPESCTVLVRESDAPVNEVNYFNVKNGIGEIGRMDHLTPDQNNLDINFLDIDQGIFSQCSDSGSFDASGGRWFRENINASSFNHTQEDEINCNNGHTAQDSRKIPDAGISLKLNNCESNYPWSNLAKELRDLKKGEVHEMKLEMSKLHDEIHKIKQALDTFTELVRKTMLKKTDSTS